MNRTQRVLTAFSLATSFMVFGVAPAQVSDSYAVPHHDLKGPAVEADAASAVRGSLGVSLENIGFGNDFGDLAFVLNGGFALLSCAVACFAVATRHREPIHDRDHLGDWGSAESVTLI